MKSEETSGYARVGFLNVRMEGTERIILKMAPQGIIIDSLSKDNILRITWDKIVEVIPKQQSIMAGTHERVVIRLTDGSAMSISGLFSGKIMRKSINREVADVLNSRAKGVMEDGWEKVNETINKAKEDIEKYKKLANYNNPKFCSNCGKKLKNTDKFCGGCGTPLNMMRG